jgi:DNA-binding NtrC family response regulator
MPRYSKSVLLIDDDPADRALFSRDLARAGFDVIKTGSAEEAMAAIVGGIGCLVTDQVMSVTGQELAKLAAGVRGDVCVVFLSGASEPREPIPETSIFIQKEDREGLREAVIKCMRPWLVGSKK